MAQKPKGDQLKLIRDAALKAAGKSTWADLTLEDIAKAAKLPLATISSHYADIWSILVDVLKILDREAHDISEDALGENWRDNLFEILMTRFDLAQQNRDALVSVLPSATLNPCAMAKLGRPFLAMLRGMLRQSGLKTRLRRPLFVTALGALYLSLIKTWQEDDTKDLAKTMAALDKRLGYFEQLVNFRGAFSRAND